MPLTQRGCRCRPGSRRARPYPKYFKHRDSGINNQLREGASTTTTTTPNRVRDDEQKRRAQSDLSEATDLLRGRAGRGGTSYTPLLQEFTNNQQVHEPHGHADIPRKQEMKQHV